MDIKTLEKKWGTEESAFEKMFDEANKKVISTKPEALTEAQGLLSKLKDVVKKAESDFSSEKKVVLERCGELLRELKDGVGVGSWVDGKGSYWSDNTLNYLKNLIEDIRETDEAGFKRKKWIDDSNSDIGDLEKDIDQDLRSKGLKIKKLALSLDELASILEPSHKEAAYILDVVCDSLESLVK